MDTAQEALFKAMLNEGWFMASGGDVEAPTGYYGYMTNTADELAEIRDAFSEVIDTYGDVSDNELIGSWFAAIDSNGIIHIHKMMLEASAREEFELREDEYSAWMGEE